MKKFLIVFAIVLIAMLQGCNSCTRMSKDFESDFGELDRDIAVMNAFSGDTIFRYSGPCYFSTDGHTGNVSLIYKVNNTHKKADFIGNFIFTAIEK